MHADVYASEPPTLRNVAPVRRATGARSSRHLVLTSRACVLVGLALGAPFGAAVMALVGAWLRRW